MIKESAKIKATSECWMSDTQKEIADLDMIVHRDYLDKESYTNRENARK